MASRVLLHTINEILDMSQLETGGMEILCADYRTTDMLSDIVNMIWLRANQKGLEFRIEASQELPAFLNGDEIRIRQVLLNVTANAVKYTNTGSVTLRIEGRNDVDGGFRMVYDVIDTGIGIHEKDIPYLFDAFQRVDEKETHSIEGTGLGLSILRQLLDMMDGTVTVTSEYGKGSTFHIEIPQTIADGSPIGEVDFRRSARLEQTKYRSVFEAPALCVLVVDDTPMNLMVVKKLLRETKAKQEIISTAIDGVLTFFQVW